jgi:hypothetical protein
VIQQWLQGLLQIALKIASRGNNEFASLPRAYNGEDIMAQLIKPIDILESNVVYSAAWAKE